MNTHLILRPIPDDQLGLLIHAYLDDCELGDLSPRTLANYRNTLEKFHWWIHETGRPLDPETIRPADMRDYLRYMQSTPGRWNSPDPKAQRPLQSTTLSRYDAQLRAFFNWLVDQEYIDRSPMDRRLRRPRVTERPVDPFSADELTRLSRTLRALPESEMAYRDRAIIAVLFDVGLRASELVNLTVGDVDVMQGMIVVRRGKGNKTRSVQLGSSGRRALRRFWIRYRAHDELSLSEPFFLSQKRKALTGWGLAQLTERVGRKAGVLPCNPHRFRHTAALSAIRAGMDLFHLQQMLGHTSLEMCRRYVYLAETDIARAAREHSPLDAMKLGL